MPIQWLIKQSRFFVKLNLALARSASVVSTKVELYVFFPSKTIILGLMRLLARGDLVMMKTIIQKFLNT